MLCPEKYWLDQDQLHNLSNTYVFFTLYSWHWSPNKSAVISIIITGHSVINILQQLARHSVTGAIAFTYSDLKVYPIAPCQRLPPKTHFLCPVELQENFLVMRHTRPSIPCATVEPQGNFWAMAQTRPALYLLPQWSCKGNFEPWHILNPISHF